MGDEDYARFLTSMREFNVVEPIGSLYEKYLRDKKKNESENKENKRIRGQVPLLKRRV